jgi:hypothetical protein
MCRFGIYNLSDRTGICHCSGGDQDFDNGGLEQHVEFELCCVFVSWALMFFVARCVLGSTSSL